MIRPRRDGNVAVVAEPEDPSLEDTLLREIARAPDVTPAAAQRVGPALGEGASIGRYRVEALLGQGGMGRIYVAWDTVLRRRVALKLLHDDAAGKDGRSGDSAARLLREARAAAALSHPNAVAVYDVGEADGTPFIAMELVAGKTLRAHIREGGASETRKARWLLQVARALDAAHRVGLVHRDIKPENILVCLDDSVKVLDFGIAKRLVAPTEPLPGTRTAEADGPPSFVTREGRLTGTPRYMSPEQLAGEPSDARSDQYAWGVVAFELLAGVHPSEAGGVGDRSALLSELAPNVPLAVVTLVLRALAWEPSSRAPSMGEIVRSLEELEGLPREDNAGPGAARTGRAASGVVLRAGTELAGPASSLPTTRRDPRAAMGNDDEHATRAAGEVEPAARSPARLPGPAPRRAAWALALAALAASAGIGLRLHRAGQRAAATSATAGPVAFPVPEPASQPLLFILPFHNSTLDPMFDSGTLEAVLESALTRSDRLNPLRGAAIRSLVADADVPEATLDVAVARRVALHLAVQVIVVDGDVVLRDARYTVSLRVTDAASGGRAPALASEAVSLEKLVPAVETLARTLRTELGDPPGADEGPGGSMSRLPEADHDYAVAQASGQGWPASIAAYEKALTADPGFALAHVGLGIALMNAGRQTASESHLALALALGDRMSERERSHAQVMLHTARGDLNEAIRAGQDALRRWPGNPRSEMNTLAVAYHQGDRVAEALELGRRIVGMRPHDVVSRANLVEYEVAANLFEQAVEDTRRNRADFGRRGELETRVVAEALLGHLAEAEQDCRDIEIADPSVASDAEADLAAFEGRGKDAAEILRKSIETESTHGGTDGGESVARSWATLGELRLQARDRTGALDAARHASTSAELPTLFRTSRVLLRSGATKEGTDMQRKIAGHPGDRARLYARLLDAESSRARGAPREALTALRAAGAISDSWLVHEGLGMAHLELGEHAEAVRELQWCVERRGQGAVAFPEVAHGTLRYLPPLDAALAAAKAIAP